MGEKISEVLSYTTCSLSAPLSPPSTLIKSLISHFVLYFFFGEREREIKILLPRDVGRRRRIAPRWIEFFWKLSGGRRPLPLSRHQEKGGKIVYEKLKVFCQDGLTMGENGMLILNPKFYFLCNMHIFFLVLTWVEDEVCEQEDVRMQPSHLGQTSSSLLSKTSPKMFSVHIRSILAQFRTIFLSTAENSSYFLLLLLLLLLLSEQNKLFFLPSFFLLQDLYLGGEGWGRKEEEALSGIHGKILLLGFGQEGEFLFLLFSSTGWRKKILVCNKCKEAPPPSRSNPKKDVEPWERGGGSKGGPLCCLFPPPLLSDLMRPHKSRKILVSLWNCVLFNSSVFFFILQFVVTGRKALRMNTVFFFLVHARNMRERFLPIFDFCVQTAEVAFSQWMFELSIALAHTTNLCREQ